MPGPSRSCPRAPARVRSTAEGPLSWPGFPGGWREQRFRASPSDGRRRRGSRSPSRSPKDPKAEVVSRRKKQISFLLLQQVSWPGLSASGPWFLRLQSGGRNPDFSGRCRGRANASTPRAPRAAPCTQRVLGAPARGPHGLAFGSEAGTQPAGSVPGPRDAPWHPSRPVAEEGAGEGRPAGPGAVFPTSPLQSRPLRAARPPQ